MKKLLFCFPLFVLCVFNLCSWVDPATVDVHNAVIYFDSADNNVTNLSGNIQFYLNDNVVFGLTDNGYLFNDSPSTVYGYALIRGEEYYIRFQSFGELEIQQTYYTNNIPRQTWAHYHLSIEYIPSAFTIPSLSVIFLVIIIIMVLILILFKVVLN